MKKSFTFTQIVKTGESKYSLKDVSTLKDKLVHSIRTRKGNIGGTMKTVNQKPLITTSFDNCALNLRVDSSEYVIENLSLTHILNKSVQGNCDGELIGRSINWDASEVVCENPQGLTTGEAIEFTVCYEA